jgi:uncharacterized protein (TIGR03435 family)
VTNGLLHSLRTFAPLAAVELIIAVSFAVSQTPGGTPFKPSNSTAPAAFDVASVRPSKPGIKRFTEARWTSDGFMSTNSTLQVVLITAFDIRDPAFLGGPQFQRIPGAPGWVYSDMYDIRAKMSASDLAELSKLSMQKQMPRRREMLRALLADRFKLIVHSEPAEIECYALFLGKNGPRNMKKEPDDEEQSLSWAGARTDVTAHAFPFGAFVQTTLSAQVGCPIVDRTGMAGKYDFALKWSLDTSVMPGPDGVTSAPDTSAPTISTALEEQLGLKLEHTKVPTERLVIDHIERPTEN